MATATNATWPAESNAVGVRFCATCLAIYRQDFRRCPLDGGTLVVGANDPWIGMTIGAHHVIDALVGEGAMGRVYRAHHRAAPAQRFAVKVLVGDLAATAQMRARFALEAEYASKLSHPNVVSVVDYGCTDGGVNYMVMDLVEGPTLGAILRTGPMDCERVIRIARQLCTGLEYAHGRGMIHRDFKPENILVVGEGDDEVARIADFGLALSTQHEKRLTTTGVVCTPAYAAPEQLRGEPFDHRVDLYALGTTMFEMLSGGILPFNGDVDASVINKLSGDAPSVAMVAPNVPPALVSIVGRLLSSAPERRPRSARAVIRALDAAISAPRVALKTDQTAPLRIPANAERYDQGPRPAANQLAMSQLVPGRRRSIRRAAMQLFACGVTLGGVLAWADLQDATAVRAAMPALSHVADDVTAPVAIGVVADVDNGVVADVDNRVAAVIDNSRVAVIEKPAAAEVAKVPLALPAELVAPAVPATAPPPKPRPQKQVKAKSAAVRRATVRESAKPSEGPSEAPAQAHGPAQDGAAQDAAPEATQPVTEPSADQLLSPKFGGTATAPPGAAEALAARYAAIGRELHELDEALGREHTEDLWTVYRHIQISATATAERSDETATALQTIEEAIDERR